MKKFCVLFICALAAVCFCGCKTETDYFEYVSELRYNVYIYSGDSEEIKIYCSEREVPYAADGIKGEMNGLIEIYAGFEDSFTEVTINVNGAAAEMSYMTAKNLWYLSYSGGDFDGDTVKVILTLDKRNAEYTLLSVLSDGVMDGKSALDCVKEYDGDYLKSLTSNGIFCGEIYIRLLYDGKCYYYVGVCGRDGKIKAYLADGETGKVIAEHTSQA